MSHTIKLGIAKLNYSKQKPGSVWEQLMEGLFVFIKKELMIKTSGITQPSDQNKVVKIVT